MSADCGFVGSSVTSVNVISPSKQSLITSAQAAIASLCRLDICLVDVRGRLDSHGEVGVVPDVPVRRNCVQDVERFGIGLRQVAGGIGLGSDAAGATRNRLVTSPTTMATMRLLRMEALGVMDSLSNEASAP